MPDFLITDFSAKGDGQTLNSAAFEKAITACAEAGGRVVVPAGTFVTGPIVFQNNVELHLKRGALIQFSRNFDHYPLVPSNYEGEPTMRCMSPLWAEGKRNIAITGEGVIDGQGDAWRPVKKWKMTDAQWSTLVVSGGKVDENEVWWPTAEARAGEKIWADLHANGAPMTAAAYAKARDFLRPVMLKFADCTNVLLEGVTFQNSPAWNVHLMVCENVTLRHVRILNPWWSSNGDGLDLDACRNARIENSYFDVGDDAICIKSGKNEAGRKRGRACENVTVDNCIVAHGHGGVTVGSEMSGGVRNLKVTNCVFHGTDIGLRFKSTRGRGGTVENVEISNIAMHDIKVDAISLNLFYWVSGDPKPEPVSERTPIFRGMSFRNITCDGAKRAIEIRGLPEMPIEKITFENVRMKCTEGVVIVDAVDIRMTDVLLDTSSETALRMQNVKGLNLTNFVATGKSEGLGSEVVGNL